jgi:hypothetical protein
MSLAPTWGIDAIREAAGFSPEDSIWATVLGASPDAGFILLDLAMVALLAIVYIAVAVILFRVVEKQARLTGELGRV